MITQARLSTKARMNHVPNSRAGGKSNVHMSTTKRTLYGSPSHLVSNRDNWPSLIQTRPNISDPGDIYELEADRVADQLMRMPDPTLANSRIESTPIRSRLIQRQCAMREDEELQRKTGDTHSATSGNAFDSVTTTLNQGGRPLDAGTRNLFEPRFGVDFSAVRIHTDAQSAQSARSVNALAYTVGKDIVFNSHEYAPHSDSGKRLLAHELTHVVQQSGSNGCRAGQSNESYALSPIPVLLQRQPQPVASTPVVAPPPQIDQANSGLWRQRVDDAIRTLFGLSGPRLTAGRAHFVDQAQFAARINAADMPEHLLMLFLSPPPGAGIHDILRHHHQSFSGIAELRRFIADRITVGSFETSFVDPVTGATVVRTITPRDLLAANIGGLATTSGPRAGRSVLIQIPADVETLVHEAIHFYVHTRFRTWAHQHPDDLIFGFRRVTLLMEGFAEYFSRQVMQANSSVFGPLVSHAYQPLVEQVGRVVATQTESLARDAYFRGEAAALTRLEQAIQINEETTPELLVPDFMIP